MTIATRPNRGNAVSNRKAGRPRGDRDDVPVKLDRALVDKAKVVAAHRQTTLAELLSTLLDAPLERAHSQMLASLANADPELSTIFDQLEQYFSGNAQKSEVETKADLNSSLEHLMKVLHERLRTSEDASLTHISKAKRLLGQDQLIEDAFRVLAAPSDEEASVEKASRAQATPSADAPASGMIIEKLLEDREASGKKPDSRKHKGGKS